MVIGVDFSGLVDEENRGDEEMMMLRREMQKDDMAVEVCLEERAVNLLT